MKRFLTLMLLLLPMPAMALPILADISSHRVEIHSAFTGTQLLVFGARNDPGDIVIVIRGPSQQFTLRKKDRVAGIWINREQYELYGVPQFYRIAASRPLEEVRQYGLFEPLEITMPFQEDDEINQPLGALKAMLTQARLYPRTLGSIEFMGPTLFKAAFNFPDNMPRGIYTAEAYLFTDGALSGMHTIPVEVYKIGADAFLYETAHENSLLYGIAAVLIALSIGGAASWLFSRIG